MKPFKRANFHEVDDVSVTAYASNNRSIFAIPACFGGRHLKASPDTEVAAAWAPRWTVIGGKFGEGHR